MGVLLVETCPVTGRSESEDCLSDIGLPVD